MVNVVQKVLSAVISYAVFLGINAAKKDSVAQKTIYVAPLAALL